MTKSKSGIITMPALARPKNMFICDANKNIECDGRFQPHCGVTCFCTTKAKYAKDPTHPLTHEEYYKEEGARIHLLGR